MSIPAKLSSWFLAFSEDVLAGRVSLDEILELVAADLQDEDLDLCPKCAMRYVRRGRKAGSVHGVCVMCWLEHVQQGHREAIQELEAQREVNRLKKQRQRLRDELGVTTSKSRGDRVRCSSCGRLGASSSEDNGICPQCVAYRKQRAKARKRREAAVSEERSEDERTKST